MQAPDVHGPVGAPFLGVENRACSNPEQWQTGGIKAQREQSNLFSSSGVEWRHGRGNLRGKFLVGGNARKWVIRGGQAVRSKRRTLIRPRYGTKRPQG